MTTVIIDYGSGNLRSAAKALAAVGAEVRVSADVREVEKAERIVLPGVGAFADCRAGLAGLPGMIEALERTVRAGGRPFLGICVGMQLMAERGLEFGQTKGFGWIDGEVRKLEPSANSSPNRLKVPHMGWNSLQDVGGHPVFAGLEGRDMYFTHSFAFYPDDRSDVAAWTTHGARFAAAVARGNLAGVQFHPEKSQALGLKLLGQFLDWRP
jgi:glutamine amidotransferase